VSVIIAFKQCICSS